MSPISMMFGIVFALFWTAIGAKIGYDAGRSREKIMSIIVMDEFIKIIEKTLGPVEQEKLRRAFTEDTLKRKQAMKGGE